MKKQADGLYHITYTSGFTPDGKRIRKSFSTDSAIEMFKMRYLIKNGLLKGSEGNAQEADADTPAAVEQ
jgi:hypothetical protein